MKFLAPAVWQQPVGGQYAWALIVVLAAAVLALTLSTQIGVLTLGLGLLAWWTWQSPTPAFFFLIVISPLLPLLKVTHTLDAATLVKDVVIVTLFARLVIWPLLKRQLPYRPNILWLPLGLLLGWLLVGLLAADNMVLGILRAREIGLYILMYAAALYLPRDVHFYRSLWIWLLATFVVTTALSIYQWFFALDTAVLRFDPARQIWIPRVSSTFGHPSVYGEYVVAVTALAVGGVLRFSASTARLWLSLLFFSTLPLIYFTYSRGVWLGFVIALMASVTAALLSQRLKLAEYLTWRKIGGTAGALLVVLVIIIQFTSVGVFLTSALDARYGSNEERIEFFARLVGNTSAVHALFGQGLGDVVVQNFRNVDVTSLDIAAGDARNVQLAKDRTLVDNQHLKTFIELGLVGLLLYAWIYWRVVRAAATLARQGSGKWQQALGIGALGFFVAFIAQGFFIDVWDIYPTNLLFWILAGLVSVAKRGQWGWR